MSEKGLKTLVLTVGALCLIWAALTFIPRGGGGGAAPPEALSGFFQGMTPEEVSAVRFQGPGDGEAVDLVRTEGVWRVNGYRADSSTVARFWDALAGAEIADLVGANPANHPRLGVAADSTWTLEVTAGGEPRSLLVGKGGARYGTAYVRLPDDDAVYLLEGNLRPAVTRNLDDWRNKQVARLDTAQVRRLELEDEEGAVVVERADTLWVLEGGDPAEMSPVRSLLGELAGLDATGFYAAEDSLPGRGGSVRVLGEGGETLLFLEVGTGEGDRWVRVEGDSITYRLAGWRAGRLLPGRQSLEGGEG